MSITAKGQRRTSSSSDKILSLNAWGDDQLQGNAWACLQYRQRRPPSIESTSRFTIGEAATGIHFLK
jgi:hypothetical protein